MYFQLIWIYFQIIFNLLSIDFKLLSIYFQLVWIYFQIIFNLLSIDYNVLSIYFQLISIYFQLISSYFNWFEFTFNWFQLTFNWCQRFFSAPKVGAHERIPSRQLYYWVTKPLMRYPLKNCLGAVFFNKGSIRHVIIWKTLHFKALTHILFSKVKGPASPKERWRKGFVFFSTPKVGAHKRIPSKQLYYWVHEPLIG